MAGAMPAAGARNWGMRWRLRLGSSLGMGLTTALAGCSLLVQSPPQVDVSNVALTGIGLFNQSLSVTLCVTNPNRGPIAFDRATFRIAVADAPLADGVTESAVAIPGLSSVLVPIAVETTIRNLAAQLTSTLETGSIAYRLSGVVQVANLPFGVPFSREGHLSLLQADQQYADMTAVPGGTRCQLSSPLVEPVQ